MKVSVGTSKNGTLCFEVSTTDGSDCTKALQKNGCWAGRKSLYTAHVAVNQKKALLRVEGINATEVEDASAKIEATKNVAKKKEKKRDRENGDEEVKKIMKPAHDMEKCQECGKPPCPFRFDINGDDNNGYDICTGCGRDIYINCPCNVNEPKSNLPVIEKSSTPECSLCLSEMTIPSDLSCCTPCGHVFHTSCSKTFKRCPICNRESTITKLWF